MYAKYPPVKKIARQDLPSPTHQPPVMAYGWGFQEPFLMAYAEKHKLMIKAYDEAKERCGKDYLVYGELTEEEKQDKNLVRYLDMLVDVFVTRHLRKISMVPEITLLRPFTDKYSSMFAIYTNYDILERQKEIKSRIPLGEALVLLDRAMNDCGNEADPLWWYDTDRLDVVSVHSLSCSPGRLCTTILS